MDHYFRAGSALINEAGYSYEKIKAYLLSEIEGGRLVAGSKIPSENELARQFGVVRMTVNRAITELVGEGIIYRIKGSGTYVSDGRFDTTLIEIAPISETVSKRGASHSAKVQTVRPFPASKVLARDFNLEEGAPLFTSEILHFSDSRPIQYEVRYVNPQVAPDYLLQDFERITPTEYLIAVAPIQRVEYVITAMVPTLHIANVLEMVPHEPVLMLRRRTFAFGKVASLAELHHPSSRFEFSGVI
ncbi:UTRA domain-containing protein [Acidithrix sp. C25]|uniref:UTRA domain-containing protein n=1 Tax=Acidithrix sp. C25 TaxID=1671482 RepID=UPI001BCFF246|nr:UTRA domain-containing protein [Acidithrix sp. C25]